MGMNYHPSNVSPEPNAHRGNWLDTFYTELKKELAKDEEPQTNLLDNSEDRVDDVSDMNGQEFFQRSILEGVYDPSYASHSPIAKPNVVMHDDGTDFPEPKNDSLLGDKPDKEDLELDNEKREDYDYIPDSMLAESSAKSKLDPNHKQKERLSLSDFKHVNVDKAYLKIKGKKGVLKDVGPSTKTCATVCWEDDNGKPIAAVAVGYPDDSREEGDDFNWIGNLEVDPSMRGHGLGTQVLDYAVKHLRGNALAVFCDNKVAIEMYKKYGFRISKNSQLEVDSGKADYYQMFIGSAMNNSKSTEINESMTKAEKDKLPDSMFGLPKQRKYPLHDETHVRAAISMFHHCKDPEDRKTLAHNICRRIKELNLDIKFKKDSPIYPYAPKDLRLDESVSGFYGLNAMLEIPLDEAAGWIDDAQHVVNEGETAVADDGTGADSDPSPEDPWYKRLDVNGDFPKNLLRNRENGPASSKQSKNIDYDKYQSELG